MATKALFNHTTVQSEQDLVESLIVESIQIYGFDVHYLPQNFTDLDNFYGEDTGTTKFDTAYEVEMYVKNVEGLEGEGDFLQQFGLEVRDQITFTVARKRFNDLSTGFDMPREGDLIWLPLTQSMYQIQHTEHESIFYQMGELFVYDLHCELFEYSGEIFNTGVQEIDDYALSIATGTTFTLFAGGTGEYIEGETVYQGTSLADADMTARVKSFDASALEVELTTITSTPASEVDLIGVDSGATWSINLPDSETEQTELESTESGNWEIEQEADEFIDFSEESPFGNV